MRHTDTQLKKKKVDWEEWGTRVAKCLKALTLTSDRIKFKFSIEYTTHVTLAKSWVPHLREE